MPRKKGDFNSTAYRNQYNSENYDRVNFTMPKGIKAEIKEAAESSGMSVNSYILEAVREKMNKK